MSKHGVGIAFEPRTLTREKQFTEDVTSECCNEFAEAQILETLMIEKAFYLSPEQTLSIIRGNPNLKKFYFTPRWIHHLCDWIDIFEEYNPKLEFGEDFCNFYPHIFYGYSTTQYNNLYNSAPQWATMDLVDSDSCSTQLYYSGNESTDDFTNVFPDSD